MKTNPPFINKDSEDFKDMYHHSNFDQKCFESSKNLILVTNSLLFGNFGELASKIVQAHFLFKVSWKSLYKFIMLKNLRNVKLYCNVLYIYLFY